MICSRAPHQHFITKPFRSPASLRWIQGIIFSLTGLKVLSSRTAPILYLVVFLFLGSGIPVLQTLPWKHRQWAGSASSVCTLFFSHTVLLIISNQRHFSFALERMTILDTDILLPCAKSLERWLLRGIGCVGGLSSFIGLPAPGAPSLVHGMDMP